MIKSRNRTRFRMALLAALVFHLPMLTFAQAPAVDSQKALEGFDTQVEQAMKDLHVPGAAVGVIQNGHVIYTKGYGVRKVGKPDPVTPDTIFALASVTKSFTTSVMATLVDEGKLDWDKPARDYLPWFQLYDPIATQLVTPRDLVTHRTGLPRHDFIRFSTPESREELVHRVRFMEPSRTFRDTFQYSNLMYVVAGYMAGQIAGTTWEDLVKQRIFEPLGMNSSTTSVDETQKRENFARPHLFRDGTIQATNFFSYQRFGIGPNGAVNSTVNDMLKYLQMHLEQGAFQGRQIISAAQVRELHKPVDVMRGMENYALGWVVEDHGGHLVLQHSGSITGFTSQMILVPDQKIGIIVLNNLGSSLPSAMGWTLVDRLLSLPPHDYVADDERREKQAHQAEEEKHKELEAGRIPNANPTLDLAAYTGDYFHPAYGTIHVARKGDGLGVQFKALELELKHYNYDWFEIAGADNVDISGLTVQLAKFCVDEHGKVTKLLLPLEPAVKPFVFTKQ